MTEIKGNKLPEVKEYKLSNGITVWLSEENSQPIIKGAVIVRAGAKDSPDTGIAHYFEHIMFKGTDKIGTSDYSAEKPIMDSIFSLYDKLGNTADKTEIDSIQKEINKLSIEQAKYVIPNEFDHLITRFGGSGLNAFTSYDNTVYFNSFVPSYIEQWASVNSERFINPVFRLFQSELETVYEEKNMYSDNMYFSILEKVFLKFYEGTPYQYSILGSTDNLKRPSLTKMTEFFNKYYVGNNMGLMLCGDFKSDSILPILENSFGRIPAGEKKETEPFSPAMLKGREEMKVKLPVPVVKAFARIYRGAPAYSPDNDLLDIICGMLNNENGTGYFDKLTVESKLMMAIAQNITEVKECGLILVGAVPKIMFQTKSGAEKLLSKEIEAIKNGEFPDSLFNSVKSEKLRNILSELENTEDRMNAMISNFSSGNTWENHIEKIQRIESITKEDIVNCANRYFTDNYLYVSKKYGNYPKDKIQKPEIEPIPFNKDQSIRSQYYDSLDRNDNVKMNIKFIDFEKDCQTYKLSDLSTFYYKNSQINNIFNFSIIYEIGKSANPLIGVTDQYLSLIGTEQMSYFEFRDKLQQLGSTMQFSSDNNFFKVDIKGFDNNFKETIELVNHFLSSAKGNKKMLKQIKSATKIEEKSFTKSNDEIGKAVAEKIRLGDNSSYLNRVSSSDIGKLKENTLVDLFNDIQSYSNTVHYSGTLSSEIVKETIDKTSIAKNAVNKSVSFKQNNFNSYSKPVIYFYDDPKARQSIIYRYIYSTGKISPEERGGMQLLNSYVGGDMTSVMFQQIREFRSLAYSAHSRLSLEPVKYGSEYCVIEAKLSTQSDKTLEALKLLNDLVVDMPVNKKSFETAARALGNNANNMFPDMRSITSSISSDKAEGYDKSKLNQLADAMNMSIEDFEALYKKTMRNSVPVFIIVGNKNQIDRDKLKEIAEIKYLKTKDIYKK